MNQYNKLLAQAAEQFDIWKGSAEEEKDWKCRLIYSICGLMGYASSWDSTLQETPSIEHYKSRIKSVFESYLSLYPEVRFKFCDSNTLVDEIYNISIAAGTIYHLDNHICPPPFKYCEVDGIKLTRGCPIDTIQAVSGIGTYQYDDISLDTSTSFFDMFQINATPLVEKWDQILEEAKWESFEVTADTEFLTMDFSRQNPYWRGTPDKNAFDSLLRIKTETGTLYYLYKLENGRLYSSRLADWKTANNGIRAYSNACLAAHNVLPPITYQTDGTYVLFKPGYLLPPAENSFIKLYSWPTEFTNIDSPFQARKCTLEFFQVLIKTLSLKGYTFEKE